MGSGRPVILIHGYPWMPIASTRTAMHLADAVYRAISYDRRGIGRSSQPWQGYDWDTYADDLADVMQATAVGHQLPVKVVVYDNNFWRLVHMEMEQIGHPIVPGANFKNPGFAALAKACGAQGFTVRRPDDIGATVDAFLAAEGAAILHAYVAADELPVLPRPDWGMTAKMAIAKLKELFIPELPAI